MMFWPMFTEAPGGLGDQVTFGPGQEMDAVTEPAGEGVTGPPGLAATIRVLLGSIPGSTQVVDPMQSYW